MLGWRGYRRVEAGQATVEGAFLIPVILLLLLLLIQPGILLYNRCVMNAAAAEGCRMLATRTSDGADDAYAEAIRRHLGSIPEQENFHVHRGGCSWEIQLFGGETSTEVSVKITNKVKPLPLFDTGADALGITDSQGYYTQRVEIKQSTQPSWVAGNALGMNPDAWVKARREE